MNNRCSYSVEDFQKLSKSSTKSSIRKTYSNTSKFKVCGGLGGGGGLCIWLRAFLKYSYPTIPSFTDNTCKVDMRIYSRASRLGYLLLQQLCSLYDQR